MPTHVNTSINYVKETLTRNGHLYTFYSRCASYIGHKLHDSLSSPLQNQMFSEMQRARADMLLVRRKYKRYSKHKMTYLGLIACVIHNAPEKKLTFYEVSSNLLQLTMDSYLSLRSFTTENCIQGDTF